MSKLIVEMEMPRGCYFCPMAEPHPTYWFCRAFDDTTQIDGCAPSYHRRSWCPINGEISEVELMHLEEERAFAARNIAAERKDDEQIH